MVSKKSGKAAKLTYAERVLGALSQVQREHRKHSVHLATLRAQVKKNAEARRDKLGPQWSHWVGKAVKKLESDGILESSGANGSTTLTPNGKKAISAARRTYNVHSKTTQPMAEDDLLWRHIMHGSVRGVKRTRRSSSAFKGSYNEAHSDDDEPTPTKPRRAKKKKVEGSARPLKNSVDKRRLTKMADSQQLQTEMESLKKAQHNINALLKDTSPLTDLDDGDDDNATRLAEKLKERDEELARLRQELKEARKLRVAFPQDLVTRVSRSASPDTIIDMPSSPTPINHTSRLHIQGVTRTQSGSIIPYLSKQPTPAPSVSDGEPDIDYTMLPDSENDLDTSGIISRIEPPFSHFRIATSTTVPPQVVEDAAVDPLLDQLQLKFSQLQTRQSDVENQVKTRDTQIATLVATVERLEESLSQKTSMIVSKNSLIAERDEYIKASKAEASLANEQLLHVKGALREAEEKIMGQASEIERVEVGAKSLQDELTAARAELDTQSHANALLADQKKMLEVELELRKVETNTLKEEIELKLAAISGLKVTVDALQVERKSFEIQLAESMAGQELMLAKIHDREAENHNLSQELLNASDTLTDLHGTYHNLESEHQVVTHSLVLEREENKARQEKVNSLEAALKAEKLELDTTKTNVQLLITASQEKDERITQLVSEVDRINRDITVRDLQLSESQAVIQATSNELGKTNETLEVARIELQKTVSQLKDVEEQKAQLTVTFEAMKTELSGVKDFLKEVVSTADTLRAELSTKRETIDRLQSEFADVQSRLVVAEESLTTAQESHQAEHTTLLARATTLEQSLGYARGEVEELKVQLLSAKEDHRKAHGQLQAYSVELLTAHGSIKEANERTSLLQADLVAWTEKAEALEGELLALQHSKEADERTIASLRVMLERLRDVQKQSVAELEDQIISAQSSPVPKRRVQKVVLSI